MKDFATLPAQSSLGRELVVFDAWKPPNSFANLWCREKMTCQLHWLVLPQSALHMDVSLRPIGWHSPSSGSEGFLQLVWHRRMPESGAEEFLELWFWPMPRCPAAPRVVNCAVYVRVCTYVEYEATERLNVVEQSNPVDHPGRQESMHLESTVRPPWSHVPTD